MEACENPYEKVYKQLQLHACEDQRRKAEHLVKQLGFMYNIFGQAIKDFVKIVSNKFQRESGALQLGQVKETQKKQQNSLIEESNPTQKARRKPSQANIQKPKRQKKEKKREIRMQPIAEIPLIKDLSIEFGIDKIENDDSNTDKSQARSKSSKGRKAKEENMYKYQSFLAQFPKEQTCEVQQISLEKEINIYNFCDKSNTFKKKIEAVEGQTKQGDQKARQQMQLQADNVVERVRHNPFKQQWEDEERSDDFCRVAGGRSKKERSKLSGISCIQCRQYYRVMQIGEQSMCECTSRHRSNRPSRNIKQAFSQQFDLS